MDSALKKGQILSKKKKKRREGIPGGGGVSKGVPVGIWKTVLEVEGEDERWNRREDKET